MSLFLFVPVETQNGKFVYNLSIQPFWHFTIHVTLYSLIIFGAKRRVLTQVRMFVVLIASLVCTSVHLTYIYSNTMEVTKMIGS